MTHTLSELKQWLNDNNYKPTIGTPKSPNGLTYCHTKDDERGYGVLYDTTKLMIEFIYRKEDK